MRASESECVDPIPVGTSDRDAGAKRGEGRVFDDGNAGRNVRRGEQLSE